MFSLALDVAFYQCVEFVVVAYCVVSGRFKVNEDYLVVADTLFFKQFSILLQQCRFAATPYASDYLYHFFVLET
jgi:hypothetical protein